MPVQTWLHSSGAWRQAKQLYVHYNGQWVAMKQAWTKTNGTWQLVFELNFQFALTASGYNFNLNNALTAIGWDGFTPVSGTVTVVGNLGSTSTSTPSFVVGSLPAGSQVTVIVNSGCYLVGAGGAGGCSTPLGAINFGNWVPTTDPDGLHYMYLNGVYPGINICQTPLIPISGSTSYTVSAKLFSYGVKTGGTTWDVEWYDVNQNFISTSVAFSRVGQTNNGSGTYAQNALALSGAVTSPANAYYAIARCYSSSGTTWTNTSSNMVVSNWYLGDQPIVLESTAAYINGQPPFINGLAGGPAILAGYPMSVVNNGVIGGGGGGGGSGDRAPTQFGGLVLYGGGGGAGYVGGAGATGAAGVIIPSGAGSTAGGGAGTSGISGNGGGLGAAGANGNSSIVIPGGAPGAAVINSSNVSWQVYGTVLGPLD